MAGTRSRSVKNIFFAQISIYLKLSQLHPVIQSNLVPLTSSYVEAILCVYEGAEGQCSGDASDAARGDHIPGPDELGEEDGHDSASHEAAVVRRVRDHSLGRTQL